MISEREKERIAESATVALELANIEIRALRAALLEMREENAELRVALQLLRALPFTGPACSREEHDGSGCEDCTAEREYRQRCIDVLAQADEALAKGGGR